MKKGIIDLGTNTFNLLIGEVENGKLQILRTEKEAVLLGMGGINQGRIALEAWNRAFDTLQRFKECCEEESVEEIKGFGTSAIRSAGNGAQFIREVKEKLGLDITIITGEEESNLIYKGVKSIYDFSDRGIIMDIGGGSTEFIIATDNGLEVAESFDIGVSRLHQKLYNVRDFNSDNYAKIDAFLNEHTASFFETNQVDLLIGASGSFETFYEMIYKKEFVASGEVVELPFDELMVQIDWVLNSTFVERWQNDWIVPIRKSMIPIAAYKIKWVINQLNVKRVILSPYSLKEGAFL